MEPQPSERTSILFRRLAEGDRDAAGELLPLLYAELRGLAQRRMAKERSDHTLQATALVHEAYLRLVTPEEASWENRAHFFRAAAQAMRSVLVDHARAKGAAKRGGDGQRVVLAEDIALVEDELGDVLWIDEAIERLAERDPELARIVELRFFGGLTHEEIARVQGVTVRTIERGWRTARAWLRAEFGDDDRMEE